MHSPLADPKKTSLANPFCLRYCGLVKFSSPISDNASSLPYNSTYLWAYLRRVWAMKLRSVMMPLLLARTTIFMLLKVASFRKICHSY